MLTSAQLWSYYDLWFNTARSTRDYRRALVCKTKALILSDKGR